MKPVFRSDRPTAYAPGVVKVVLRRYREQVSIEILGRRDAQGAFLKPTTTWAGYSEFVAENTYRLGNDELRELALGTVDFFIRERELP